MEAALLYEDAENNARSQFSVNKSKPGRPNQFTRACYQCGKDHDCRNCPYKEYSCNLCKRKGHLAAVCFHAKNKKPTRESQVKNRHKSRVNLCEEDRPNSNLGCDQLQGVEDSEEESLCLNRWAINTVAYANGLRKTGNFTAKVVVNGVPLHMTVDTGAVVSVCPDSVYYEKLQCFVPELKSSSISLKTYTGEPIQTLGEFQANVSTTDGQHKQLPMIVVKSVDPNQPILMGRNWLKEIRLDWSRLTDDGVESSSLNEIGKNVPIDNLIMDLKNRYVSVFDNKFGAIKNVEVDLVLKENARPVFCKPHNVPFALRPAVEAELKKLEDNGIIKPVTRSDWATPIVVVPKNNGAVRLCGNYKITVNPCVRTDHYPLPVPDEIFNKISGAKVSCKLDMANAYLQCKISDSAQELLTINTHKGLYRYLRLPYGISSAGPLFQAVMDKILSGLENTYCYLDDILLTAKSIEEMYGVLEAVLKRLQEFGVKVNNSKSEFFKSSISFLGHELDEAGIHPSKSLTEAIVKAPKPENVPQLRSYLGLINYYGKFLPNLSSLLYPLYQLLNKGAKWEWCDKCEEAFQQSKNMLVKNNVLIPFDPNLDIIVSADASQYGIGAVLALVLPNGTERPVAFASRTLSKCEVKYAQLEKEALALIFAVRKFHNFLYGRKFKLVTDHRALTFLLGPTKAIPTLAAARIQRWALILSAYQYDLVYKKGSEHGNADALSRLPYNTKAEIFDQGEINFFSTTFQLPITYKEIGLATKCDPTLSKVLDLTRNGWPSYVNNEQLKPFCDKSLQLSVEKDCLLWGSRVIIPPVHQKEVLELLHTEHPGESRMKALARSYVWWPNMDREIEKFVSECNICQKTRESMPLVPLQQWSWPNHNWQRLHLDFATFDSKDFLILVDSRSKWVEIFLMPTTTSAKVIEKLRTCFAAYGLPNTVVTDGGPQFTSQEFNDFLKVNGIHHVLSPPYHPASNGLAERMVRTTKEMFLKQLLEDSKKQQNRTLQHRLDNFLFSYRNTPHTTTGISPAELFLKTKPRTPLSLLKPHLEGEIEQKQEKVKNQSDRHRGKHRLFVVGDKVFVRTVRQEKLNWQPGIVTKVVSPVTYLVKVDGRTRFVHSDHLKVNVTKEEDEGKLDLPVVKEPEKIVSPTRPEPPLLKTPPKQVSPEQIYEPPRSHVKKNISKDPVVVRDPNSSETEAPGIRRSQRSRKAPDKLTF